MGQILMSRKESSVSREKQKTVKNNVSEQWIILRKDHELSLW
jgi:hypothetical protein